MLFKEQFDNYLAKQTRRKNLLSRLLIDVPLLIVMVILLVLVRMKFTTDYLTQSDWGRGLYASGAPSDMVHLCIKDVHNTLCRISLIWFGLFVLFTLFVLNVIYQWPLTFLMNTIIRKAIRNKSEVRIYQHILAQYKPYETLVMLGIAPFGFAYTLLRAAHVNDLYSFFSREFLSVMGLMIIAVCLIIIPIDKKYGVMWLLNRKVLSPRCFHKILLIRSLQILLIGISFYVTIHLIGITLNVGLSHCTQQMRSAIITAETSLLENLPDSSASVRASLQQHFANAQMPIQLEDIQETVMGLMGSISILSRITLIVIFFGGFVIILLPMASTLVFRPGIFLVILLVCVFTTGWFLEWLLPSAFQLKRGTLIWNDLCPLLFFDFSFTLFLTLNSVGCFDNESV